MRNDNKELDELTFTETAARLDDVAAHVKHVLIENNGRMDTGKLLTVSSESSSYSLKETMSGLSLLYVKRLVDIDDRKRIVTLPL